ncbi:MAG: sensor histidine kinase [Desulfococcaceae bacterium]
MTTSSDAGKAPKADEVEKGRVFSARLGTVFGFRLQVVLGLVAFFLLSAAMAGGGKMAIDRLEKKMVSARRWERFLFKFERARLRERDFFAHDIGLKEAVAGAAEALAVFEESRDESGPVEMVPAKREIREALGSYFAMLEELQRRRENLEFPAAGDEWGTLEAELGRIGDRIAKGAARLRDREREEAERWLRLARKVPAYFLIILLALTFYANRFLSRRFLKPLNYLLDETRRIARGDFTPIQPIQSHRDEFASMEGAINRMLRELENRQKSLIESYKLRALGILTAGVAHELNNPINNIMLTAYSLQDEYDDSSKSEHIDMIGDIIGEAERSRGIVHNLLDFARESQAGAEAFDLGALVEEVIKLAQNQARVQGIPIRLDVQPGLPAMMGDQQKLKQVFLNLVMNALDAVDQDGLIQIRVRYYKLNYLSVQVEDNGDGIPPEALPHIFDPFFTTKPVGKGTGLGLSVSRGIVDQHGGRIEVNSRPGEHTIFNVILPYYPGWCPLGGD